MEHTPNKFSELHLYLQAVFCQYDCHLLMQHRRPVDSDPATLSSLTINSLHGFPAHLHTCSSFPHQSHSRHTSSLPLILSDGVACFCQAFQPSFTFISCLIWSCPPVLWILDYLLLSVWICPPLRSTILYFDLSLKLTSKQNLPYCS